MLVWVLHNVSPSSVCLSVSARAFSVCRRFKARPKNRPLIIVWCVSGSAVRLYKQRLGVFIAGREREAGAPLEGPTGADHRGEARFETSSGGRETTGPPPPLVPWSTSPFSSAPQWSSAWSGSVWLTLPVRAGLDGEAAAMTLSDPTMK